MGFFKSVARFAVYPIIRPAEQARDSFSHIRGDIASLKEARARRALQVAADKQAHLELTQAEDWDGYKPTVAELNNPGLITDPYMRFEVLYSMNQWTEESLTDQLTAVRLTKWVAAYTSALLMICGLLSLIFSPVWIVLIVGPLTMTGSAVGFASSVKHAIYQAQIESRKLITFKELMSRSDLLSYLFSR